MKKIILLFIISIFLLTSCNNLSNIDENSIETGKLSEQIENDSEITNDEFLNKDLKESIDLSLKPNEAGEIMILMYHNIGSEEKEWVRTPLNFRKDMETLYKKGYRPISLRDYVSGNITTEQGYTPVVITFDDGNLNNFEYLESGDINNESAVGLLIEFNEKHKDFPLEATFFLNGEQPFRQNSLILKKLSFIIDSGMDIGNHTKDHNSFKNVSAQEIQKQIGAQAQYLNKILYAENYEINTLALPFGERPKDAEITKYLASGRYNDVSYENIAIMNVGWNPGYSPYVKKFDNTSIPRIRASEMNVDNVGMYNYIDYFDRNPDEKFISDGVPGVITIPEEKEEFLNTLGDREIYKY